MAIEVRQERTLSKRLDVGYAEKKRGTLNTFGCAGKQRKKLKRNECEIGMKLLCQIWGW